MGPNMFRIRLQRVALAREGARLDLPKSFRDRVWHQPILFRHVAQFMPFLQNQMLPCRMDET